MPLAVPIIYNNKNVFLGHNPSVSINPNNSRYEKFAEWICSRESLFRFGLDCSGWILPTVIGGALRNKFSFYESLFQTGLEVFGMGFATSITKLAGKISAFFHLNPDDKKNFNNLVLFSLNDLDSPEKMQSSASRIMTEEINDLNFLSGMSNHSPEKKLLPALMKLTIFFLISNLTPNKSKD